MPKPKTDYNPDGYNRESFANIMQFCFSDQMIRHDRVGSEGFWETQQEIFKLRSKVTEAYLAGKKKVLIQRIAEGVLLWMRQGATVEQVVNASNGKLLKRAKKLGR